MTVPAPQAAPAARPANAADPGDALLDVREISIAFGGLKAVQGFSLRLPPMGLHGLIGPNGAGKTTAFNLLTGVYAPHTGSIRVAGRRVDGLPPHRIAQAGLARTFQNIRLFGELSVFDNVRMGAQMRHRPRLLGSCLRTGRHVGVERMIDRGAAALIELLGLAARSGEQAKHLPYGDQRRLEIARALATEPAVLLLDEPAAGMNPAEKADLMGLIRLIRDRFRIGILLIEHDMKLVMTICERVTVLDHGETIAVGTPEEVRNHPDVIEAYLGEPIDKSTS